MARGEMEGIVWLDDFAFVPKNIGLSVRYIGKNNYDMDKIQSSHYVKLIDIPTTATMETKFMSKLINLQSLEHNNKERIKKLIRRCYPHDGK